MQFGVGCFFNRCPRFEKKTSLTEEQQFHLAKSRFSFWCWKREGLAWKSPFKLNIWLVSTFLELGLLLAADAARHIWRTRLVDWTQWHWTWGELALGGWKCFLFCFAYIVNPRQGANDRYKDHLDGQLTSAEGEQTKGPRPEFWSECICLFVCVCIVVLGTQALCSGARGGVCWRTILGNSSGLHGRKPCWLCTSKQVSKSIDSFWSSLKSLWEVFEKSLRSLWKVFEQPVLCTCLQGSRLHVEGCGVLGFWEGAATRSSLSEINFYLMFHLCLKSVKNMDFPSSSLFVTWQILNKKLVFLYLFTPYRRQLKNSITKK